MNIERQLFTPERIAPAQFALAFLNQQNKPQAPRKAQNPLAGLPDLSAGTPEEVWEKFFKENKPSQKTVFFLAERLHLAGKHKHLIALLNQAILNGKAEPSMYEVLAISMKIENYPSEQIERVLLSNSDFTPNDFPRLMVSGAYLNRMGIPEAALKMYRQASEQLPTQQEPYLMGFRIAKEIKDPDQIGWTAGGLLTMVHEEKHRAERARAQQELENIITFYKREKQPARAAEFQNILDEALQVDLSIKVLWSGDGDIDLSVREPAGTVCSTLNKLTENGGAFLHDGFGPNPKNCYEEYRCGKGMPGQYMIEIKHLDGKIVGKRVRIQITTNQNSPQESRKTAHLTLSGNENKIPFKLEQGRRPAPQK